MFETVALFSRVLGLYCRVNHVFNCRVQCSVMHGWPRSMFETVTLFSRAVLSSKLSSVMFSDGRPRSMFETCTLFSRAVLSSKPCIVECNVQ